MNPDNDISNINKIKHVRKRVKIADVEKEILNYLKELDKRVIQADCVKYLTLKNIGSRPTIKEALDNLVKDNRINYCEDTKSYGLLNNKLPGQIRFNNSEQYIMEYCEALVDQIFRPSINVEWYYPTLATYGLIRGYEIQKGILFKRPWAHEILEISDLDLTDHDVGDGINCIPMKQIGKEKLNIILKKENYFIENHQSNQEILQYIVPFLLIVMNGLHKMKKL